MHSLCCQRENTSIITREKCNIRNDKVIVCCCSSFAPRHAKVMRLHLKKFRISDPRCYFDRGWYSDDTIPPVSTLLEYNNATCRHTIQIYSSFSAECGFCITSCVKRLDIICILTFCCFVYSVDVVELNQSSVPTHRIETCFEAFFLK